jgi:Ca-activated chloride channel family protein
VFHERIGAHEYALLMVLPPTQPKDSGALPREVIYVIDTSGSMGGSSIAQARASLDFALGELSPADRFNIVEFNSGARRLFPQTVDSNIHNLARAREFVRHLDAGGGTEMRSALELALPLPLPDSGGRVRQVVFITDGAVGNEVELFREIERRLGGSRLFTVGIGSAPNSWFMRTAARVGRGDSTFIGDVLDVQEQMQRLFRRLGQTVMADFKVDWPVPVETYPAKLPDLYPGEPLVVAARADDSLQGSQVAISGRDGDSPWTRELLVAPPASGLERAYTGIGAVWARARIESLMDQKILGGDETVLRDAVLSVALEHQLVSPYTSFVALEQEPSRPPGDAQDSHSVPNLRPAGQTAQPYAYPRTATSWRLQLLLGLVLLVCTCVFWRSPAWQRP